MDVKEESQMTDGGLLTGVVFYPSENCDERPVDREVSLIVVHNISLPPRDFESNDVVAFFCNQLDVSKHPYYEKISDMRVSAHIFIRRDGEVIQFVPFTKRAWHAGESTFAGQSECNDFSIGIELEGADDIPYAQVQYEQLAKLIDILRTEYPAITQDRIVGHSDVAPGRKTDPGPSFDWRKLKGKLA